MYEIIKEKKLRRFWVICILEGNQHVGISIRGNSLVGAVNDHSDKKTRYIHVQFKENFLIKLNKIVKIYDKNIFSNDFPDTLYLISSYRFESVVNTDE